VIIVCKFGGDPAICLREEAICAKFRPTDGQTDVGTDDGRLAIALAHSWDELKTFINVHYNYDLHLVRCGSTGGAGSDGFFLL